MRQLLPGDLVRNRHNQDIDLDNHDHSAMISTLPGKEICMVVDVDPEFPAAIELLTSRGRGWTYDANVELVRVTK